MCSEYNVVGFDEFLNSYEIRKSSEIDYVSISFYALVNKKPFDKKMIGDNSYILAETWILYKFVISPKKIKLMCILFIIFNNY